MFLFIFSSSTMAKEHVDLLLHNAYVFTADDMLSVQSAFAIKEGKFVEIGGNDLLEKYKADQVIDVDGKFVVPGFNDTHIHVRGNPPWYIDLESSKSIGDIQDVVAKKAGELTAGHWITGYGWAEGLLAEGRAPSRDDLDSVAPDNPVVLARAGGHSVVANSMALRIAGLTSSSPDPDGGVLERDESGKLNGIIRERLDLFYGLVPKGEPELLIPDLIRNLRNLLQLGVTSITLAGAPPETYRLWQEIYESHPGQLPRTTVQIFPGLAKGGASVDAALEVLRRVGQKPGEGDEWLRVGAVKLWLDGGYAGPAAWTLKPYKGQPEYFGIQNIESNDLYDFVLAAHQEGWQFGLHTIGDAAIQLAVEVIDQVMEAAPRHDPRHYLNHFTIAPPNETMEKMARRNIAIAQQPNFTWSPTLESRYVENLEGSRLEHNNPLRTPSKYGIFIALGSDNHPIGPMPGLYAAVTRRGHSGKYYAPAESLTMPEALVSYTRNGAYLTFEEKIKGTIEAGKLADFAVLSSNLIEESPNEILNTSVLMTVLGGRIVYKRGSDLFGN